MAVFNNLVVFDPNEKVNSPDKIVPDLAESWSWDPDQTKLTFKLRTGVKWHDGKPFSAKDVKCTWDALIGKVDEKSDLIRKNPRKVWYSNLKDVTVGSDTEVTFVLGRPQPSFLSMLAAGYSPVYACHANGRDMRSKPIGTGPFKVVDFKRNESIKLVRNPDYWKKGRPYLDAIDWKIVPNRSTRILGFVAGEFDMTFDSDITFPMLKDVKAQKPDAVCEARPTNVNANILINREGPPFDKPELRRALVLSIDQKAFNDILFEGHALYGAAMLPPPAGVWGMPKEMLEALPGFGTDIAKNRAEARKIMEKLGYTKDKPLKIKVSTRNIAIYRDPAVILIDQLKAIYIDAELDPIDTTVWYTKIQRKDYSVGMNLTGGRRRRSRHELLRELPFDVGPQLHGLQEPGGRRADREAVGRARPRQAQEDRVGDREEARRGRRAAGDQPQRRQHLLDAADEGPRAAASTASTTAGVSKTSGSTGRDIVRRRPLTRFILLSPARGRGWVRGPRTSIPPHLTSPPSGGEEPESDGRES